jgi:hypothetical protein
VRVLVGEGSPVELGTLGLILDVELPGGGVFSSPVPSDFNGFVYMLEGEASFGANMRLASRSQIALLGPGSALTIINVPNATHPGAPVVGHGGPGAAGRGGAGVRTAHELLGTLPIPLKDRTEPAGFSRGKGKPPRHILGGE